MNVDFLIGLLISGTISLLAWYKQSLDISGMIAAILVGTAIYVMGGMYFTAVILVFFITSSLLGKLHPKKTSTPRNYKQVLANGLIGMVLSILFYSTKDETYTLLYTISFAVSTSDTWGSELGTLFKQQPRHIITFQKMDVGLSGGVTLYGTIASLLGSIIISAFMMFNGIVILFGFLGSILDSLLGTVQVKYRTSTHQLVEDKLHPTEKVETLGIPFLTNNMVNFLSNGMIVLLCYFLYI